MIQCGNPNLRGRLSGRDETVFMNPTGYQSSHVSALPLLLPKQAPGARKKMKPVPSAVRQMLFDSPQQRVPVAWICEQWSCSVRWDAEKGKP